MMMIMSVMYDANRNEMVAMLGEENVSIARMASDGTNQ